MFFWYLFFVICSTPFQLFLYVLEFSYTGHIHGHIRGHANIHDISMDICMWAWLVSQISASLVVFSFFFIYVCIVHVFFIFILVYLLYTFIPFLIFYDIFLYWTYPWRHPWTCKYPWIYLWIYACELGVFPRFLIVLHVFSYICHILYISCVFYINFCISALYFHAFSYIFLVCLYWTFHGDIRGHANIHGYIHGYMHVSLACFPDFC